ncbi:hypothetical protein I79_018983 [Cricetulus griseus]|uniref:Uncharacterized protein n=1 Tax=Cricetulus griseus TaxID=10029 RepID=G3I671_CRIGR|nr:hypothetical protein I79_018983 [Cricetulus griseus]
MVSQLSYRGDPLSEASLVETPFFLPLDPWHPTADGDCRGTLVQPPAQPVIETYTQPLDTACPSSSTLPFLDEPSPESLLPRLLEEPAPAASSASDTELASSHMDLSQM